MRQGSSPALEALRAPLRDAHQADASMVATRRSRPCHAEGAGRERATMHAPPAADASSLPPADGRHQVLPPVGLQDARPPRELHHQGHRGHHRCVFFCLFAALLRASHPTALPAHLPCAHRTSLAGDQSGCDHPSAWAYLHARSHSARQQPHPPPPPPLQAPLAPASATPSAWRWLRPTSRPASTSPTRPS
jgi:hypothetical protein